MAIAAPTSSTSVESSVGRAALIGGLLGFVAVWIAVAAVVMITSDVDVWAAVALGAFVGSWGGLGFGAMLAASVAGNKDM